MQRSVRWIVWTSLAVASMTLVFGLAILVGRAVAASRLSGAPVTPTLPVAASSSCPLVTSRICGDAGSDCPVYQGDARPTTGAVETETSLVEAQGPTLRPTPTDLEILLDPSLPVPPGRTLSCH